MVRTFERATGRTMPVNLESNRRYDYATAEPGRAPNRDGAFSPFHSVSNTPRNIPII